MLVVIVVGLLMMRGGFELGFGQFALEAALVRKGGEVFVEIVDRLLLVADYG